jgi:hypothetical protein
MEAEVAAALAEVVAALAEVVAVPVAAVPVVAVLPDNERPIPA